MKNLEQYVGRKVKGVKFDSKQYNKATFVFLENMEKFVGEEGVISEYYKEENSFRIDFKSPIKDYWYYPAEVILPQLEGELIGYLINIDEKYVKIIAGLANHSVESLLELTSEGVHFTPKSYIGEIVAKYDLLDKCTPVYKTVEVKLPKINGYEGEDKGDYLQYGCAKLLKSWSEKSENRYITSLELDSHVRIESKQISLIREYLLSIKK